MKRRAEKLKACTSIKEIQSSCSASPIAEFAATNGGAQDLDKGEGGAEDEDKDARFAEVEGEGCAEGETGEGYDKLCDQTDLDKPWKKVSGEYKKKKKKKKCNN